MRARTDVTATIYPSLCYDDARAAIEWLVRAFGFEKRLVVPGPDGTVLHSELSFGNGVIMVGSPKPDRKRIGPRALPGRSHGLCVRVADPDAHCARAKAAGAVILQALQDEDYGSRGYLAADLEGHEWYFGTYLPGAHWEPIETARSRPGRVGADGRRGKGPRASLAARRKPRGKR